MNVDQHFGLKIMITIFFVINVIGNFTQMLCPLYTLDNLNWIICPSPSVQDHVTKPSPNQPLSRSWVLSPAQSQHGSIFANQVTSSSKHKVVEWIVKQCFEYYKLLKRKSDLTDLCYDTAIMIHNVLYQCGEKLDPLSCNLVACYCLVVHMIQLSLLGTIISFSWGVTPITLHDTVLHYMIWAVLHNNNYVHEMTR